MRYRVTHRTVYAGDQPVSVCHNEAWLRPRELSYQQVDSYQLQITPTPSCRSLRTDYFGNEVAVFSFQQGYDTLTVEAVSELSLTSHDVSLGDPLPPWEMSRDEVWEHATPETMSAFEFVFDSPMVRSLPELEEYARASFPPGRPMFEALSDLTARIHTDFEYDPRATTVSTPVQEVFRLRKGVCQDFAHLQIAALRSLGLAARYVSGYLRTYPPPGQPRLVGADASHAWLSVYCAERGWFDVDPTNNLFPDLEHITVGWGRDYSDVCPVKGVFLGGGRHALSVSVDVQPLDGSETPPER